MRYLTALLFITTLTLAALGCEEQESIIETEEAVPASAEPTAETEEGVSEETEGQLGAPTEEAAEEDSEDWDNELEEAVEEEVEE